MAESMSEHMSDLQYKNFLQVPSKNGSEEVKVASYSLWTIFISVLSVIYVIVKNQ